MPGPSRNGNLCRLHATDPAGWADTIFRIITCSIEWFASDLTPALSSKERENYIPSLPNSRDWICRTFIRKIRNVRLLFLLPGGEGQVEGGRKHKLLSTTAGNFTTSMPAFAQNTYSRIFSGVCR
jgi:hypothetical protein